ncbi:ferredoxin [Streptomyces johnsoniae]|uniref:Ferredoxin n=1 Tax=Streptomyces johnsoniae TaxID=3075532 RepID=A0ABU2S1I3_9ACTN|nr:ferredoxin [Streptomyces sp. DSM 41886]MDT0442561.1 ferredoxin [Streptomyces sp. DSM 41886]
MKVRLDRSACVSSGMCALLAPEVFDLGEDDGVVVLLREAPPEEHQEDVRRAVHACPADVIAVEA